MSNRMFVPDLIRKRERGEKITVLTAYDFAFAGILDQTEIDAILVGDSLGTVVQGHETTLPVTIDEIIYHAKTVVRAVSRALVIADMPFMSFQLSPEQSLSAAGQIVKESGVSAVKLEGGDLETTRSIERIVRADIPVMGHVGLTPQSYHRMGGHRVQGRHLADAEQILADAIRLQEAGVFAIVLEGIPAELAQEITETLSVPTIGIGAGPGCSGQVLVTHDLLGLTPIDGESPPKFVKQYADVRSSMLDAVADFVADVRGGTFPDSQHSYHRASETKLREVK